MKSRLLVCIAVLLALPLSLIAQSTALPSNVVLYNTDDGDTSSAAILPPTHTSPSGYKPFSQIAFGGGISAFGISSMTAINIHRYANLRITGGRYKYTINAFSTNGFTINGSVQLAAIDAAIDIYPFYKHGWRISPGILFGNNSRASGTFTSQSTTQFSLNDYTFYPSAINPVVGTARINLHNNNPAFSLTTGWGNIISRKEGRHLSFPFEVGAAFIGTPSINFALTSGQVCDTNGQYCVDVTTDPVVQSNLQAQLEKYRNKINSLNIYPILSFGVAYRFRMR